MTLGVILYYTIILSYSYYCYILYIISYLILYSSLLLLFSFPIYLSLSSSSIFPTIFSSFLLFLSSPSIPIILLFPSYSSNHSPPILLFLIFHQPHSKYTCRHLDILIYIPDSSRQFDPAQTNGVDG